MKRLLGMLAVAAMGLLSMSQTPDEPIISQEKGSTVINTTALASDIEGYVATTPVKIYVKKGRVERIEALENEETPKYFNMVEVKLLQHWNGMPVKKAETAKVDVVTGATVSSEAIIENVRRGLSYYNSKAKN